MALTAEDIRALVTAFDESDWDEMSLQIGDSRLELTRTGRPPMGASAPAGRTPEGPAAALPVVDRTAPADVAATAAPAPAAVAPSTPGVSPARPGEDIPDGHRVTSPSLGLFWRSRQPGAPPFVDVGQVVTAEDTVCIVEVMKLMNHVKAGVAGRVTAIGPENGAMVEYGETLVVIDPEG